MAVDPQILKHGVDVDIHAISIGTASGWGDANPMVVDTFKMQFLSNYKKHILNKPTLLVTAACDAIFDGEGGWLLEDGKSTVAALQLLCKENADQDMPANTSMCQKLKAVITSKKSQWT